MKEPLRVAIVALGLVGSLTAQAEPGTSLSSPAGRYVYGQISSARRDQLMLDTATGRLWATVCADSPPPAAGGQCNTAVLQPVLYVNEGGLSVLPTPAADLPHQNAPAKK